MGRIEELPDDFDEALDLNKEQQKQPQRPTPNNEPIAPSLPHSGIPLDAAASNEIPFPINEEKLKELEGDPSAPKMPPAMASVKSHTADEIIDMMNKTPLFMTDLEKAGDEQGENTMLDAIRALQNEGTRAEVAQNFREQGNESAKAKMWKDAKEFYTKGIAVLTAKEDKWDKPEDVEKEKRLHREVEEACYINRALCNLELKNYRSTTLDCAAALKLNPKNVKAYYRSAMALLALDKVAEAEDAASRGLQLEPKNKALEQVASKIAERKAVLEKIAAKKKAEEERSQKEKMILSTALRARQIRTRTTNQPPDMEDAKVHLAPDPLSPESMLVFPTVFLYPMDAQSDFVKKFSEMDTIADHLSYIFPLPWDSKQEYTLGSVDCYVETVSGGLIKAGKKVPLLKILSGGKVEVVDGLVRINVVPTAKAGKWIEEMKARKGS